MSAPRYPVGSALEMSRIPAEARERFIAELPSLLDQLPQMEAALPQMAELARAKLPTGLRWLFSVESFVRSMRRQLASNLVWVDDRRGTITLNMRVSGNSNPFYSQTVPLAAQGMVPREDTRSEAEGEAHQPGPATQDAPILNPDTSDRPGEG